MSPKGSVRASGGARMLQLDTSSSSEGDAAVAPPTRGPGGMLLPNRQDSTAKAAATHGLALSSFKSSKSKGESSHSSGECAAEADTGSPMIGSRVHRSRHNAQPADDKAAGEAAAAAAAAAAGAAAAAAVADASASSSEDGGEGPQGASAAASRAQSLPEVTQRLARLERQMMSQRPTARSPERASLRRGLQDLWSDVRNAAARGEAEGQVLVARLAALEAAFRQREWGAAAGDALSLGSPTGMLQARPSAISPTRLPARPLSAGGHARGASAAASLLASPGLVPRSIVAAAAAVGRRVTASPEPRSYAPSPPPASSPSPFVPLHHAAAVPQTNGALLESLASQQQMLQRQVDASLAVQGADITNLAVAVGEIDDASRQVAGAVVEVGCAVEGLMQRVGMLEAAAAADGPSAATAARQAAEAPGTGPERPAEVAKALRRLDRRLRALEARAAAAPSQAADQELQAHSQAVGECRASVAELSGCIEEVAASVAAQEATGDAIGDAVSQLREETGRITGVMESLVERVAALEDRAEAAGQADDGALSERVAALLESRLEEMVAARVEEAMRQHQEQHKEQHLLAKEPSAAGTDGGTSAEGAAAPFDASELQRRVCELEAAAESASVNGARTEAGLIEVSASVDRLAGHSADAEHQAQARLDELSSSLHQLGRQVVAVNEGSAAVEDVEALKESVEKLEERVAKERAAAEAAATVLARKAVDEMSLRVRADAMNAAESAAEVVASGAAAAAARNVVAHVMASQEGALIASARRAAEEAVERARQGLVAAEVVGGIETRLGALERAQQVTVQEVTEHVAAAGEKLLALEAETTSQATALQQSLSDVSKEVTALREEAASRRLVEREAALTTAQERLASAVAAGLAEAATHEQLDELRTHVEAALQDARSWVEDAAERAAFARASALRDETLAALAFDRESFEQAIEELQGVVETRCITKELLGQVFAARDDMRHAWSRMQNLFDAAARPDGLFTCRVRRSSGSNTGAAAEGAAGPRGAAPAAEPALQAPVLSPGQHQVAAAEPGSEREPQNQQQEREQPAIEGLGAVSDSSADPFSQLLVTRTSCPPSSGGAGEVPSAEQRRLSDHPAATPTAAAAAASKAELAAVVASHATMRAELAELHGQVSTLVEGMGALQESLAAATSPPNDSADLRAAVSACEARVDALQQQLDGHEHRHAQAAPAQPPQQQQQHAPLPQHPPQRALSVPALPPAAPAGGGAGGPASISRQSSLGLLSRQLTTLEATLAPEAVNELRMAVERLDTQVASMISMQEQQQQLLEAQQELIEAQHQAVERQREEQADAFDQQWLGREEEGRERREREERARRAAEEEAAALAGRLRELEEDLAAHRCEVSALSEGLHQLSSQVVAVNEGSAAVEDVEALKEAVERIEEQLCSSSLAIRVAAEPAAAAAFPVAAEGLQEAQQTIADQEPETTHEADAAAAAALRAALPGASATTRQASSGVIDSVLSAPLSVVVQLQSELEDLRAEIVTRDQIASLARAVADLRRRAGAFGDVPPAAGTSSCGGPCPMMPEDSQGSAAGASTPGTPAATADATAAAATAAAAAASSAAEAAERHGARLAAAEAQIAVLRGAVEDVASRMSLMTAAAAQQQAASPLPYGGPSGSRGHSAAGEGTFSEVVPALANFKALVEGQGARLDGLQDRLEAAEAVAAAFDALRDELVGRLESVEGVALGGTAAASQALQQHQQQQQAPLSPQLSRSGAASAASSRRASRAASTRLGDHEAPATNAAIPVRAGSGAISRSASSTVSAAGSEELSAAVAGPIGVVHRILIELKKRVEALEVSEGQRASPSPAAAAGLPPGPPRRSASGGPRRSSSAAAAAPSSELAAVQLQVLELQRALCALCEQVEKQQEGSAEEGLEGAALSKRVAELEEGLLAATEALEALREQLQPVQECMDATQQLAQEVGAVQEQVVQRLQALERTSVEAAAEAGAAAAVMATATAASTPGEGVSADAILAALAAAAERGAAISTGALRKTQEDLQALSRRVTACEVAAGQASQALQLIRRLAAKQADNEARVADVAGRVSGIVGSTSDAAARLVAAEGRSNSKVNVCRKVLDNLADQLVAVGHMGTPTGRASPAKNPLAGLGPKSPAMVALENKVEAVRTALTASVKLLLAEMAAPLPEVDDSLAGRAAREAGAAAATAMAAARSLGESHDDVMKALESRLDEMKGEIMQAAAPAAVPAPVPAPPAAAAGPPLPARAAAEEAPGAPAVKEEPHCGAAAPGVEHEEDGQGLEREQASPVASEEAADGGDGFGYDPFQELASGH